MADGLLPRPSTPLVLLQLRPSNHPVLLLLRPSECSVLLLLRPSKCSVLLLLRPSKCRLPHFSHPPLPLRSWVVGLALDRDRDRDLDPALALVRLQRLTTQPLPDRVREDEPPLEPALAQEASLQFAFPGLPSQGQLPSLSSVRPVRILSSGRRQRLLQHHMEKSEYPVMMVR